MHAKEHFYLRSGGDDILVEVLGQDASEGFHEVGHSAEAMEQLKELKVGELDTTPVVRLKEMKVPNLRSFR